MKWKLFSIGVVMLFMCSAALTATVVAKPPKDICELMFSGRATFDGERGYAKGFFVPKCLQAKYKAKAIGAIFLDDHETYIFKICKIRPDNERNGIFYGKMVEVKKCYDEIDLHCVSVYTEYCCKGIQGRISGDYFLWYGWLIMKWKWRGHSGVMKCWIGTLTYPEIECHP